MLRRVAAKSRIRTRPAAQPKKAPFTAGRRRDSWLQGEVGTEGSVRRFIMVLPMT